MIAVAWNCRGVGNRETIRHAKILLANKDVGAIFFLETKTNKADNLLKTLSKLGFHNSFMVNTIGFAGGLLLAWNKDILNLEVVGSNSQTIHCKVLEGGSLQFHLSFAYVRPNLRAKELFWSECKAFGASRSGPWVILGDFNDIANISDHWGSDQINMNNMTRFCEAYEECGLMEVPSTCPNFTWIRQIGGCTVTRRRLDRVFWNIDAQEAFQEAKARVLTRTHSDHHPISFVRVAGAAPNRRNRPFRFEAAWLAREDYRAIWKKAWSDNSYNVVRAIYDVTHLSRKWNEEVFGNIFRRKRLLQARIQGIQMSPWYSRSQGLQVLERKLLSDLSITLSQEELLWFQKSRKAWIQDGDKNTNFYHRSTIIRRSRGRVRSLKINGEWNSEPNALKEHVSHFFYNLFCRVNQDGLNTPDTHSGPRISREEAESLIKPADSHEVKKAVFGMKRMGSPGPDDIQAAFYQDYWDEVGNSITMFVNEALATGKVPISFLESFITLIPKKTNPESAADFRPITLLNVIFKIVSKVLVNRMRPIMINLVGPHQNSFLPGRSTMDNIVLTQEVMHSINQKKGKKGSLVMKIDLHKAYDSINWGFLKTVLSDFGFPLRFINLILFSLKESTISILWNGEKLPPFESGRGLRQGDPLAPYLFILAMEKLSYLIQEKVREKDWKPIHLARGGIGVSHLFFADDLMIFGESSETQMATIMDCLNRFSHWSGLNINHTKSLIFCSNNTPNRVKRRMGDMANIPITENLGKYLGIPILQKRVSKNHFNYIINNMKRKLNQWKAESLSLAGRRVLVQSALATVPVYTMQTGALPVSTCNDIDKLCRDFLWGSNEAKRKIHLINWKEVCSPRTQGGLGLRMAKDFNLALLAKLAWQILNNPEKLWVKVMRQKYIKDDNFFTANTPANASWTWRSIIKGRSIIETGARWRVGSGDSLDFWSDWWVSDKPIGLGATVNIPNHLCNVKVSEFITQQRTWDVNRLLDFLPPDLVNQIRAIPIPIDDTTEDKLTWPDKTIGTFSVLSAFKHIAGHSTEEESWDWMWKLNCIEKVKSFLWLLLKGKLLTGVERRNRNLTTDASCKRCPDEDESTNHIFRTCPFASDCWRSAKDYGGTDVAIFRPFNSWIKDNCSSKRTTKDGAPWNVTFVYILWLIWKARNNLIFNNKAESHVRILNTALSMAKEATEYIVKHVGVMHGYWKWVRWEPPQPGWLKLNTDGAMKSSTGIASAGGVIRDEHGRWVKGFSTKVGATDSFSAELWGLREGLRLCLSEGIEKIWVEMDSATVVAIMNNGTCKGETVVALIKDCFDLINKFNTVRISHIMREGNQCADWLANFGQNIDWGTRVWNSSPSDLNAFMDADTRSRPVPRIR
ncbi:PREDICTED: uncharacterized protein LOC109154910 [Ipomoea nil]|uniref:uncharacterized protein LOC109154910 n=1 Tax=Ipomoea nil TaxID=35883 RepID=UPI0009011312|nr:PREDICTED: uncharacterized protein LOC109154910 [Ipomoea nil]